MAVGRGVSAGNYSFLSSETKKPNEYGGLDETFFPASSKLDKTTQISSHFVRKQGGGEEGTFYS